MNGYATLADLRQYLGLSSAQTQDDDLLLSLVEAASRLIERHTGRRFYPARRIQRYTVADPAILPLRDDLLALASLTNGDGRPVAPEACHLHPPDGPVWTI
ncbi:MAG: phage gp6-like head-tail connector protein, partial [Chloroflexi bacterium]|nr:phage gp6-like head-tail connector protein [Chloroflexota bacterium]